MFVGLPREGRHRRALLLVVLGSSERACGAPGGGARQARHRDPDDHRQRPAGDVHAGAAPAARAARRAAGRRHPGGAVGDRARERLAAEHRAHAACDGSAAAGAREGALRRPPPARADDARDLRGRARDGAVPGGGDVARGGRAQLAPPGPADLGLPHRPHRLPHRGLRPGAGVGLALASGRLRHHPERRARASRGGLGGPGALGRLHRASRPAQGAAGPAQRLARDPPPHGRATPRRGRRSPGRSPAALAPPRPRDGHRRARVPEPGRSHRRAASGRRCSRRRRSAWRASAWC